MMSQGVENFFREKEVLGYNHAHICYPMAKNELPSDVGEMRFPVDV